MMSKIGEFYMDRLRAGDNFTVKEFLVREIINPNTHLDGAPQLFTVIENNHLDCLMTLIEYGADVNAQDESGTTPIWVAVVNDNPVILSILLYHGAKDAKNRYGCTASYHAERNFKKDCFNLLKKAGRLI